VIANVGVPLSFPMKSVGRATRTAKKTRITIPRTARRGRKLLLLDPTALFLKLEFDLSTTRSLPIIGRPFLRTASI